MEVGYQLAPTHTHTVVSIGPPPKKRGFSASEVCCFAFALGLFVLFLEVIGIFSSSKQTEELIKLYGEPSCTALGPNQTEESARRFGKPVTMDEFKKEAARQQSDGTRSEDKRWDADYQCKFYEYGSCCTQGIFHESVLGSRYSWSDSPILDRRGDEC